MNNFKDIQQRNEYLIKNKEYLLANKKLSLKFTNPLNYIQDNTHNITVKKQAVEVDIQEILVKAVINTTNIFDDQFDVLLPNVWNKTLKENRNIWHTQEHKIEFDKIIADGEDLKVSVKQMSLSEITDKYNDFQHKVEALIFESTVKKIRNPFMFNQYNNGWVNSHSVALFYTKIGFALNDEYYKEEFALYNNWIDKIANRQDVEKVGYFYPVFEARLIEGSAVVAGSHPITPTISVQQKNTDPYEEIMRKIDNIEQLIMLKPSQEPITHSNNDTLAYLTQKLNELTF